MKKWNIKIQNDDNSVTRTVVYAENSTDALKVASAQFSNVTIVGQPTEVREE